MSLLTPDEMENYGGIGTHDTSVLQMAIDLAEFDIEQMLGTYLTPTTVTNEESPWPYGDGKLVLMYDHVTSITSVTAKHSIDSDCNWVTDDECGVILNSEEGIIKLVHCMLTLGNNCNCAPTFIPDRAVVTYVAGYSAAETDASTALGKALRMAITLRARDWIPILEEGDDWQGAFSIESWNSMDYSERRKFMNQNNALGPGVMSQEAARMIDRLRIKPAIMLKGSGKY